MIELPFLVPPQMTVGKANTTVDILIMPSALIWPDHEHYVCVTVRRITKPFQILAEAPRVPADEHAIDKALREIAAKVGNILDRENLRLQKLLPGGLTSRH